jgi:hypothetical protein
MIRHEGQGPGRTPAEAETSPTLPLDGTDTRDAGTEPTVPLEAADVEATGVEAAGANPRAEPEHASPSEPQPARYDGREREHMDVEEHGSVDLARLAWLVTVGACLIAVAILVVEGYYGYAAVTFAVAAAAALNLT